MIKPCFNLIEIALAIAIIAVGMSSIMVLYPVGVNSSKAAAANNMIPDVADYVLSYLECEMQARWRNADGYAQANVFADNFGNELDTDPDDQAVGGTWSATACPNLAYRSLNGHRIYRYTQSYDIVTDDGTATVTDFQAVIRVWVTPVPVRLRPTSGAAVADMTPSPSAAGTYAMALCAEISYPAEIPYGEREKHVFRREIYNHAPDRP